MRKDESGRGREREGRETSGKTDIDSRTCTLLRECRKPGPLALSTRTRAQGNAPGKLRLGCAFYRIYMSVRIIFSGHAGSLMLFCWVGDLVFLICAPNMDVVVYFFFLRGDIIIFILFFLIF